MPGSVSGLIGFMVVEPSPIPSEPPKADWDGEIHLTQEQAEAECAQANSSGSEPSEPPDECWRVVAVVELGALADAKRAGGVKALELLRAEAFRAVGRFHLTVLSALGLASMIESGEVTL